MKKNRIIALVASILCMSMLMPSCNKLHKKEPTKRTKVTKEETEETSEPQVTEDAAVMQVLSLDQFISDGLFYTEDVALPSPTPIPFTQTTLGLTNEVDGYFSGPLQDAAVVDNEFFRYTIFSAEATPNEYILTGEFENKTDIAYILYFFNPILDNSCNDYEYLTDTIPPHTVVPDVTKFSGFPTYDGTEPDRIAFEIRAVAVGGDGSVVVPLSDPELRQNYVPVNLYPHGEESFVYEEQELPSGSRMLYDSEISRFDIESYEMTENNFVIHYSVLNKTSEYIQIKLDNRNIVLDDMIYSNDLGADWNCRSSLSIAPYARQTGAFAVSISDIEEAGNDPMQIQFVSFDLTCISLTCGLEQLWKTPIKEEVVFG